MRTLKDIFAGRPVLCDGAMGTVLYARGVFINRCYDELNLSDPALILSIHEEYLQSGAEILETNTFGANRFRLARHGLASRTAEINQAGVRLARQAAEHLKDKQAGDAWVAGSVGPLGVHLEPLGKTSLEEARAAFAEQIAALAEAGADMLMVETMPALNEAREALLAAKEVAPELPVFAMITVDDDGNCLDGSSPGHAAKLLTEWGADVIGCNCSTGPATVLTAIEAMRTVTDLPLVAMPNAGMPRAVEGRNIYLCSPEYMASFARKAIKAGAQYVGGCCGTTPNHIRAMKSAIRAIDAQTRNQARTDSGTEVHGSASTAIETETPPAPLAERSRIGALVAEGTFVTLVEIVSPRGIDCSKEIEGARLLASLGVHAINVPDSPRASARMSAQSLCIQIQQHTGIETLHGGHVAAVVQLAAQTHFTTTLAAQNQPDILTLHLDFLLACVPQAITITVIDLKVGKGTSTIQLQLTQKDKLKVIAIATFTNFSQSVGPTAKTDWAFRPPPKPVPNFEKILAHESDENWLPATYLHSFLLSTNITESSGQIPCLHRIPL